MRNRFAGLAGVALLCALVSSPALAQFMGDYAVGTDNICRYFTTYQPSTGASFTIASEAVDVYSDDSATQDADDSGLTLDDDFDGVTGFHQICVDTSSDGTFYSAGKTFTVMLSAGTVDSVSVAGTPILIFTLAKGVLAAGAITATVVANNAIDAATFAADVDAEVLSYIVDDATRIDASELNGDIDSLTFTVAGDVDANSQTVEGSDATDQIRDAVVDDATRIDASELNGDIDSLAFTVAGDVDANTQTIAGAAVSTSSAQIGVNVVNVGGSAVSASSGLLNANVTQVSGDSTAADNLEAVLDLIVNTGNGAFPPFSISASGTAQSYTAGTPDFVLASSTAAADDDFNGQTLTAWGDEGELQSACISDYTGASDTALLLTAFNTDITGTIRYVIYPTLSCEASGGSLTAADVWANATRTLTAIDEDSTTLDLNATTVGGIAVLDEDSTTIDLNATQVGGVAVFDEDSTTIDIDATTIGTVTTATNVTTVNGLAAGVVTAAAVATGAIDADAAAADLTTELQAGLATAAALAAVDTDVRDVVIEDQGGGVTLGCAIAVIMAYAAGDLATSGSDSTYEDPSGTETRVEGTVASAGNRTATITCPTY